MFQTGSGLSGLCGLYSDSFRPVLIGNVVGLNFSVPANSMYYFLLYAW